MTIGERIKKLRESKNMSQQELAEAVGYSTASAVNKIEMGLRDVKQKKIQAFADALGVSPGYLLGDTEQIQDELFTKRKLLFDLSSKATEDELDKFIKILATIMGDEE